MAGKLRVAIFGLVLQAWTVESDQGSRTRSPSANPSRQAVDSTQLHQQINASMSSVVQNMAAYKAYMTQMTDRVLDEHQATARTKVDAFKSTLRGARDRSLFAANPVVGCLVSEARLAVLAQQANEQIKRCATVSMAEMTNVISDSLNEAQTFMSIPQVIGRDVQRCGLSHECRWDIVGHAISEAVQVPPKVFALTAKIQSIVLRTVISIDGCGMEALRKIAETGMEILDDVFACISNQFNSINATIPAT
ncbi:hypothetical protein NQ318_013942 [Aromia moschata]|uniref:Secreted protein n=1 Tax=Aromia moschata TaxID=1265417 RepID=A0AAV8Z8Y5_9CUCU|nr:hypothetical protein NQ318_013942 [Aromia moschata]